MGQSDRILKKENQHPTRQSRVLEEAIRRRPSEKSVRSAAGQVRLAELGGLGPLVDWTALNSDMRHSFKVVFTEKSIYGFRKQYTRLTKKKHPLRNVQKALPRLSHTFVFTRFIALSHTFESYSSTRCFSSILFIHGIVTQLGL